MNDPLVLTSARSQARLLPGLGGAVGSFSVGGRDILRPTPADATDPLETACFPLVPYANRIAEGRFTFEGADYALPPNHPAFPGPLHGLGWMKAWSVTEHDATTAILKCTHSADAHWPWDWSAVERFELIDGALRITLELTNLSQQSMPAGLGLHPYFPHAPHDELQFDAAGLWQNDEAFIPARQLPAEALGDFAAGAVPSPASLIDNCYFGWQGTARWGETTTVRSRQAPFLHVFVPPGQDFVCLEPMTQMPAALNQPDFAAAGGIVLAPGATQVLEMEIGVRG